MKPKLLSILRSFTEPYLPPCDPQVLDVPPAQTPRLKAMRLMHNNPAERSTRHEKLHSGLWACHKWIVLLTLTQASRPHIWHMRPMLYAPIVMGKRREQNTHHRDAQQTRSQWQVNKMTESTAPDHETGKRCLDEHTCLTDAAWSSIGNNTLALQLANRPTSIQATYNDNASYHYCFKPPSLKMQSF